MQVMGAKHEMAQHAAEGRPEVFGRKDLIRRTGCQHRAPDQHHPVAEFGDRAEVVGRDQHHPALVAHLPQQVDDGVFGLHIDPGEGFVQQDDAAPLRQCAGQKDALSLSARQFADLALAEIAHADAGKGIVHGGTVGGAGDAEKAHMAVAAHHHHVLDQDGKGPIHFLGLGDIGDEVQLLRLGYGHAKDRDMTGRCWNKPHQRLEKRRFSGAVHPHQRGDRAGRNLESRAAQGGMAVAIGDRQVANADPRGGVTHPQTLQPPDLKRWFPK